jgi:hypothetical protein
MKEMRFMNNYKDVIRRCYLACGLPKTEIDYYYIINKKEVREAASLFAEKGETVMRRLSALRTLLSPFYGPSRSLFRPSIRRLAVLAKDITRSDAIALLAALEYNAEFRATAINFVCIAESLAIKKRDCGLRLAPDSTRELKYILDGPDTSAHTVLVARSEGLMVYDLPQPVIDETHTEVIEASYNEASSTLTFVCARELSGSGHRVFVVSASEARAALARKSPLPCFMSSVGPCSNQDAGDNRRYFVYSVNGIVIDDIKGAVWGILKSE